MKLKNVLTAACLIIFIVLVYFLNQAVLDNLQVREIIFRLGYAGIFLIAFINGFNVIVPFPTPLLMPGLLEAGLNFYAAGLIMAAGMSLADLFAFWLGHAGRRVLTFNQENKTFKKIIVFIRKYRWSSFPLMFIFAALVPLPNEVIALPLGFFGYRASVVFIALFLGNLVHALIYSLAVIQLFKLF